VVFFDFPENGQENLKETKECLQTAQDFYSAAVNLSEQGLYRPAVDSLYSATELAISAQLWVSTSQRFLDEKKKKHTTIDQMHSRDVKGTHPLEFYNNFYNL
jgi:predicted S18 family serine protease